MLTFNYKVNKDFTKGAKIGSYGIINAANPAYSFADLVFPLKQQRQAGS